MTKEFCDICGRPIETYKNVSEFKLKNILGGNCYTYDEGGIFYTWESFYDDETRLCDFELKFFIEEDDGRYFRFDEYQTERAWSLTELSALMKKAGLSDIEFFADRKLSAPAEDEQRIFVTARKREEK